LHALGLFAASWLLHRDLAAARPHPAGLTGYYLWIAAGGLLAGLLCGLLAPLLLRDALEYPLLLLLAALLVPAPADAAPRDVGGKAARRALGAAFGLLLPLLLVGFSPGALLPGLPALLLLVPLASALGWAFPHG